MKKSRFSEEQIIGFLKEAEAGMPIKELGRKGGFSDFIRQLSITRCIGMHLIRLQLGIGENLRKSIWNNFDAFLFGEFGIQSRIRERAGGQAYDGKSWGRHQHHGNARLLDAFQDAADVFLHFLCYVLLEEVVAADFQITSLGLVSASWAGVEVEPVSFP